MAGTTTTSAQSPRLFEVAIAFVYYLATGNSWVWSVLLVVAILVLLASAPVSRAVWAAYGVIGVYAALAHYVEAATGSWRTTVLLTVVGLLLVGFGVVLDVADSRIVRALTRPAPWLRPPPPPAE